MLDDFAVAIEAEDINSSVLEPFGPDLVAMQNHQIAFRDGAFYIDPLARVFTGHAFEIIDEGFFACPDVRIVLDVVVADEVLYRTPRLARVEHQFVKNDGISPVGIQIRHSISSLKDGRGLSLHPSSIEV